MKLPSILLAGFLAAAVHPDGLAGNATNAPAELDVEECVSLALGASDNRTAAEFDAMLSQADRDLAGADSMPHLNITPGARWFSEGGDVEPDIRLDLGRRFLEVPQNRARRRIADTRVEWARHRKQQALNTLTAQVWRAYIACLREGRFLQGALTAEDVAGRIAAQWAAVTARGAAIDKERRAAAAAVRQARMMRERADSAQRQAQVALRALCGLAPGSEIRCRGLEPFSAPLQSLERCQAWALASRSDHRATRMDYDLSVQAVRLAHMDRLPTPQLGLGYGAQNSSSTVEGRDGGYLMLGVQVPVWDAGETAARVRKAEAQSLAVKAEMAKLELDAAQAVAVLHLALEQALAEYEAARSDPAPQEDFDKIEVQHLAGGLADLEFERARLKLMDSERDILAKNLACYEAAARLLEAMEATWSQWSDGLPEDAGQGAAEANAEPGAKAVEN